MASQSWLHLEAMESDVGTDALNPLSVGQNSLFPLHRKRIGQRGKVAAL